jgi:arylsulfatase A-like enzyme
MKEHFKFIAATILLSSTFAICDHLFGLLADSGGFRAEGLGFIAQSLLWGQPAYLLAGLVLGTAFMAGASVFKPSGSLPKTFLWQAGAMSTIFAFLLMSSLTPPGGKWKLFLCFIMLGAPAILAGYGVKQLWGKALEKYLGGPFQAAFLIFQAMALSAAFVILWTLRLPVNNRAKAMMCLLAAAYFIFCVALAKFLLKRKTPARVLVYLMLLAAGLSLPVLGYRATPRPGIAGRPAMPLNIIWIIADSCRADALGIYSGSNQTPNLDQMAREGALFTNAYSQAPWTLPSIFSMTTSLYPSVIQSRYQFKTYYGINARTEFFAERLQKFGYRTAAVTAHYAVGDRGLVLRGYDLVHGLFYASRLQRTRPYPALRQANYLFRMLLGWSQLPDSTELITRAAQQFLDKPPRPFFLWVHYYNPHEPYNPPLKYMSGIKYEGLLKPPFFANDAFHLNEDVSHPQGQEINLGLVQLDDADKQFVHQLYLGNARYLDEKIAVLLKTLKGSGLEKNTIVIFTADHGEEFWEHGQRSHGQSLYDELIHVPLIIWGAGIKPQTVVEPVALIDLVPTLARMIGIEPNPNWQGRPFDSVFSGGEREAGETIYSEGTFRPEDMKAVRANGFKLIVGAQSGRHWLFDLNRDPAEQKNIYSEDPAVAGQLQEKLDRWQAKNLHLKGMLHSRKMNPAEQKEFDDRLRALGYIK